MKDFPLEKYKFVILTNKVIAISSYAGKTVKGIAKCRPTDKFDIDKGKALAAARCNLKVAKKRMHRAEKKLSLAADHLDAAQQAYGHAREYQDDADYRFCEAWEKFKEIERKM